MKIVLFGGTTEGRRLSEQLAEAGAEVLVCVASEYGKEEQGELAGVEVRVGALSAEEKRILLREAALCVDATHPYARHISCSVREACAEAGVEYLRLRRDASACTDAQIVTVASAAEAADWLAGREGNVLLTTGAKELSAFSALKPERLYARVLPSHAALDACEALGIPHRNILAMQGPFSAELNLALIRQYHIRFLVTKDGGREGGFPEKAAAVKAAGIRMLVLARPAESGLRFDEVLNLCITRLRDAT